MSGSEVKSLSRVRLFVTPWTVAYQAPPSMGFSRQEYWNGLPFPSPYVRKYCIKMTWCKYFFLILVYSEESQIFPKVYWNFFSRFHYRRSKYFFLLGQRSGNQRYLGTPIRGSGFTGTVLIFRELDIYIDWGSLSWKWHLAYSI